MESRVLVRLEIFKTIFNKGYAVDATIGISKTIENYLYSNEALDKGVSPPRASRSNKQISVIDKGDKPPIASTKDAVLQDT